MREIPLMIRLLLHSQVITQADVRNLLLKLENSADKTVEEVLLESGIVNERELQTLQLAEDLIKRET
jgi:hypothetical protein